jgi:integrase
MATHLIQKPGESTWYVRMAVPVDVRHAFGGLTKLVKTTGTSNKAEAMDRRLPILARWKADIAAAREQRLLERDKWRPELASKGLVLSQSVDVRLLQAIKSPPMAKGGTTDEILDRIRQFELNKEQLILDVQSLEAAGATGLGERIRQRLEQPPTSMIDGVQAAATITRDTMIQIAQRRYALNTSEITEARAIVNEPTIYKPASPLTDRRLELFRAYRMKSAVALKTIDQQESKLKDLSRYLKSEGRRLDKSVVWAWLATKSLSSKTKLQYLLAGSTFWQWAIEEDAEWKVDFVGENNPFAGHKLPKLRPDEKAKTKRKAYTVDEVADIFAAALSNDKPALCDLIKLGYYTGARIEELAKLRKDSVITVEGVRLLDIDNSKSYAGVRQIPIHPQIENVIDRLLSNSTDGFLLKSSGGNKYGTRSDPLSKAFGRLKTSLGFGKQHVFHSVRSTNITQLLRQSIPGNVVANIVGHETGLVTFDIYDEGASPQQKLEAICKLPLLKL